MEKKDIKFITFNENGSMYVCYGVLVQRGLKRKGESKANEVLIIGVPKSGIKKWLHDHDLDCLFKFIGKNCSVEFKNEVS